MLPLSITSSLTTSFTILSDFDDHLPIIVLDFQIFCSWPRFSFGSHSTWESHPQNLYSHGRPEILNLGLRAHIPKRFYRHQQLLLQKQIKCYCPFHLKHNYWIKLFRPFYKKLETNQPHFH